MKSHTEIFKDKETIVGYVETDSGSLLITDGIWEDRINLNPRNKVALDLGVDRVRIPIIATRQNEQRFLLIPLDQSEAIKDEPGEKVTVEEKAEQPAEKTDKSND